MSIEAIIRELPKPDYKIVPVPPTLSIEDRLTALEKNYESRVNYIHNALTGKFPDIGVEIGKLAVDDRLTTWAEVLVEPEERLLLEAAKVRAVSHEQRPPQYVTLGLTDIDYFDTNSSLVDLRESNKDIERTVTSTAFKELSQANKKKKLSQLEKSRDENLHPLVFILSLNVDDLKKDDKRKLRLLHSLGKHEDARKTANSLLSTLQKSAIANYRQCVLNNSVFNKTEFRTFS